MNDKVFSDKGYIEYEGGRRVYLDEDDCPELGREFFAKGKRGQAGLAELIGEETAALWCAKPGRPKSESPKKQITIRVDEEALEAMRSVKGWQTDLNARICEWYLRK
ncbi:MAG: BrnA antitoxin family protein [Rickettsiales bacterium]